MVQDLEERIANTETESVDDKVENPGIIKGISRFVYNTTKATAATLGMTALVGAGAPITAGGFALGKLAANMVSKTKTTYRDLTNSATIGALMGGFLHYLFTGVNIVGAKAAAAYGKIAGVATKGVLGIASIPPFMYAENEVKNVMIDDYQRKSSGEMWNESMKTSTYFGLPVAANVAVVPNHLKFYGAAIISTLYSLFTSSKKKEPEEKKEAPIHQLPEGIPPEALKRSA